MDAVKCTLVEKKIHFSDVNLPLETVNSKKELLKILTPKEHAVFCINLETCTASLRPENLVDTHHFYELNSRRSNKPVRVRIERPKIQLFFAPGTAYDDPQIIPVALHSKIKKTLKLSMLLGGKKLSVIFVNDRQYNWLLYNCEQTMDSVLPVGPQQNPKIIIQGDSLKMDIRKNNQKEDIHPHAYSSSVLEPNNMTSTMNYKFVGKKRWFESPFASDDYGNFWLENKKRSQRSAVLHSQECPFCSMAHGTAFQDRDIFRFSFSKSDYYLVKNENPIVESQFVIFSAPSERAHMTRPNHRIDINADDILLIQHLTTRGFDGLTFEIVFQSDVLSTSHEAISDEKDDEPDGIPKPDMSLSALRKNTACAVYVNAYPGTGRSIEHAHLNVLYQDYVGVPRWSAAPWQIACDEANKTTVSRIEGAPFYAITIDEFNDGEKSTSSFKGGKSGNSKRRGKGNKSHIELSLAELHKRLNSLRIPYNLMAYPEKDTSNEDVHTRTRFVLAARSRERSTLIPQRIAGLELLSGVCIVDKEFEDFMTPMSRDRAFKDVTLDSTKSLEFERELRKLFGRPQEGHAVYAVAANGGYIPKVLKNDIFIKNYYPAEDAYWGCKENGSKRLPPVTDWSRKADILVSIARIGISQSDRRILQRKSVKKNVLGFEAGGFVVDPGNSRLHAGQKVVLVSYESCKTCEHCRTFSDNLCKHLQVMGTDFNGGFAQLVALPRDSVIPVSTTFNLDAIPLVESIASIAHALFKVKEHFNAIHHRSAPFNPGIIPAVVFGAGPIGCLAALAIQRFWRSVPVMLVEPIPERREFASKHKIATYVEEKMPSNIRSQVSIVASNNLDAYFDAMKSVTDGGTAVYFAGLDTSNIELSDSKRLRAAEDIQYIHRNEILRNEIQDGRSISIIGSKGAFNKDIRTAVHELEHYYESHYACIQNVRINGLLATNATTSGHPPIQFMANDQKAIEAYLSPAGTKDVVNGDRIKNSMKVLVSLNSGRSQ